MQTISRILLTLLILVYCETAGQQREGERGGGKEGGRKGERERGDYRVPNEILLTFPHPYQGFV